MTLVRPAVLSLALLAAACSPGPMIDRLPDNMGLPSNAPARPATAYQYPAVHDMPPARSSKPMSEDEQVKLEKDLAKLRDRQAPQAGGGAAAAAPDTKTAVAPTAQAAKKKAKDVIVIPPAGAAVRP